MIRLNIYFTIVKVNPYFLYHKYLENAKEKNKSNSTSAIHLSNCIPVEIKYIPCSQAIVCTNFPVLPTLYIKKNKSY